MTKPQVHKRAAALRDLAESGAYIGRESETAELRYYDAAEQTFRQLAESSGMGRRWQPGHPTFDDVRVWRIKGFENWLIFYRAIPDGIEVLRVLHGARDVEAVLEEGGD